MVGAEPDQRDKLEVILTPVKGWGNWWTMKSGPVSPLAAFLRFRGRNSPADCQSFQIQGMIQPAVGYHNSSQGRFGAWRRMSPGRSQEDGFPDEYATQIVCLHVPDCDASVEQPAHGSAPS